MEIMNLYASGEGYISYLLIRDLVMDYNLPICVRFHDRILPDREIDLALLPYPTEVEREALKTLKKKPIILAKNCKGLENCKELGENFVLESLKRISKLYLKEPAGLLENYTPPRFEETLLNALRGKLRFYIPFTVAKREAILEAWRHYLGIKGFPLSGYIYPFEAEAVLKVLSNIAFTDKVFPLILGKVSKVFLEGIKKKGFVPFEVILPSKNNLESELNYIFLAQEVAKGLKRI